MGHFRSQRTIYERKKENTFIRNKKNILSGNIIVL
jgi:hypothetical protein